MLKDNKLLFQLIDEKEQLESNQKEVNRVEYYKKQLKKLGRLSSSKLVGSAVTKKLNSKMRGLLLKDLEGQLARDERSAPQELDNLKRMDGEWKAKYMAVRAELGESIRQAVLNKQLGQDTGNRILNLLEQGQSAVQLLPPIHNSSVEGVRRLPSMFVQPQGQ